MFNISLQVVILYNVYLLTQFQVSSAVEKLSFSFFHPRLKKGKRKWYLLCLGLHNGLLYYFKKYIFTSTYNEDQKNPPSVKNDHFQLFFAI